MNMTMDEIKEIQDQIRKDNLVDKTTVSKYKRKKISAPDNRFSAKAIGLCGVGCLVTVGLIIILMDLVSLMNTFTVMMKNVVAFFRHLF